MADHGYFEELITAELDGELTPEQRAELDEHLAGCEQCRTFRDALSAVEGTAARHLPEPPAEFTANVMAAVRAQAKQKKKGKLLPFPGRSLAAAAAAALVLWAGVRAVNVFRPKGSAAPMAAVASGAEAAYEAAPAPMEPELAEEDSLDLTEAPAADNGVMNNRVFAADAAVGKALPEDELLCQISDRDGPICTLPVSELPEGLLVPDEPCADPDREPDYIILVYVPEGDPEEYWLWAQDDVLIVETNTGEIGYTVSAEIFREFLSK